MISNHCKSNQTWHITSRLRRLSNIIAPEPKSWHMLNWHLWWHQPIASWINYYKIYHIISNFIPSRHIISGHFKSLQLHTWTIASLWQKSCDKNVSSCELKQSMKCAQLTVPQTEPCCRGRCQRSYPRCTGQRLGTGIPGWPAGGRGEREHKIIKYIACFVTVWGYWYFNSALGILLCVFYVVWLASDNRVNDIMRSVRK